MSQRTGLPTAADGSPLPWYTYPSISFLDARIPPSATVFEFGMGNSTLWWSNRASKVSSVEHDEDWFNRIAGKMPANVKAELRPLEDGYVEAAQAGSGYSVVVIDGRKRVRCMMASLETLAPDGVVVWDNSERGYYQPGYDLLTKNGFRRLDFWGLGPVAYHKWCTSVFYRPNNCLGI